MNIGVIGLGYWGPNVVRNFLLISQIKDVTICDINNDRISFLKKRYPLLKTTTNYQDIIKDPKIDAVAVVTPVSSHFELGKDVLDSGKHLFIEKPFTASVDEAKVLIELANKKQKIIMVDHTFLFTPAVKKINEIIHAGDLGDIYYYDSRRINLGLIQSDVNVVWDLASHDFSIMNFLIKEKPVAIASHGVSCIRGVNEHNLLQVSYITIYFQTDLIAHFNLNWISPVKVRDTLIGGSKKMLRWDDLNSDEKIRVYDKGVEIKTHDDVFQRRVSYRSGDMVSPKINHIEALTSELKYFVNCIDQSQQPFNDGEAGLRVVEMLEACDKSVLKNSEMVKL